MRHGIDGNRLGRSSSLLKATLRDIAKATLLHQRICTTKAKAKQARRLVEKLITLGKKDTLAAKRRAFAILCDHSLVSDLFKNIAGRFKSRLGGYTRIIPLAERRGDNAFLVYLELTEKVEVAKPVKPKAEEKTKVKIDAVQPKKEQGKIEVKKQSEETKKETSHRQEISTPPPKKDLGNKGQSKSALGGIKRLFNKKPPSQ